jgi:hypothetical protein
MLGRAGMSCNGRGDLCNAILEIRFIEKITIKCVFSAVIGLFENSALH